MLSMTRHRAEIAILVYFDGFSEQNMGQMLFHLNSKTIFVISSSRQSFKTPNMKAGLNFYCLASTIIFKVLYLVRDQKKFILEKNGIDLLFTSHGTGLALKTRKKLSLMQNETPYWSLDDGLSNQY